jgi:sec-independent protein translocase protein TatA
VFSGLENPYHLLILGVILLLVFGPKRLPGLGRSLGSGIRNFKDSLGGEESARRPDAQVTVDAEPAQPAEQSPRPPSP